MAVMRRSLGVSMFVLATTQWACAGEATDKAIERLGEEIFFDSNLSVNRNQSCAACHAREVGWTGPDGKINKHGAVYEGSVHGRFGNRKPPASAYATASPLFDYRPATGFFGGTFWDGRATGWKLGNPAADQAQGPFLNPAEQALPDAAAVVAGVCTSDYAALFKAVWGLRACDDVSTAFDYIALSIKEFEGSSKVSQFSSKYDAYLAGRAWLSAEEEEGRVLFTGKAKCAGCHTANRRAGGEPPLFTDFAFDNLGVPKNPENPFYEMDTVLIDGKPLNPLGDAWLDVGLAGFLGGLAADNGWRTLPYVTPALRFMSPAELTAFATESRGKQRAPSLRNVDLRPSRNFVKPYSHNGYFKSLKGIVHFYNTRDVLPRCTGDATEAQALAAGCWPAPEIAENLNTNEVGNLGLTPHEEDAIVSFLATLSDGWHDKDCR